MADVFSKKRMLFWGMAIQSIEQYTNPKDRAQSLGVFRFWRDLGYAIGAVATGIIADHFGINAAILCIAAVTLLSALVIQLRFKENGNININQ
jgi:predicted MFS family arabinose efflux permease